MSLPYKHWTAPEYGCRFRIGRFEVGVSYYGGGSAMGRLGGGWYGKIGVMWAKYELCIELIAVRVRFRINPKESGNGKK